jgi:glycosyltransferase involved in cell wall biosynthesis
VRSSQLLVIYNSPPDRYSEFKSRRRHSSFLNSELTIFYGGILEKDRGLLQIVEAVQRLDKVKLVVAGFGSMETKFVDAIMNKNNIEYLGRISYEKVLERTFSSDCLIALYDPFVPNNVFASPNKLFEAMMCAKPIIVSKGTSMANVATREKCGFLVSYADVSGLSKLLTWLSRNQDMLERFGKNGRRAYEARYSWYFMTQRLLSLYSCLIGHH